LRPSDILLRNAAAIAVNPNLDRLHPYPFEKLRELLDGATPPAGLAPIRLSIGEPRHATPAFIKQALADNLDGLATYPTTQGTDALRGAIAAWMGRRYGLNGINPSTQVLPVTGTREALFAFAQCVIDASRPGAKVLAPNPFYQIYEGAALLAAAQLGRDDFRNILMFSSLSKRSNVPGLRSGFVAGDAKLVRAFHAYRTYHGCAMSPAVQAASVAAWNDEAHVEDNRRLYREKFARVTPILAPHLDVQVPDAGFYLWARTPVADTEFARRLVAEYNVTVLPGSFLARESGGINPGAGFIRIALVAETAECIEGAERISALCRSL
jgi:aspartate/methionine/tyrosine aminotransferase